MLSVCRVDDSGRITLTVNIVRFLVETPLASWLVCVYIIPYFRLFVKQKVYGGLKLYFRVSTGKNLISGWPGISGFLGKPH